MEIEHKEGIRSWLIEWWPALGAIERGWKAEVVAATKAGGAGRDVTGSRDRG